MPLTRIDSAFLDLDAIGGIDFDVQSGVPTLSVDATNHRVGIGTDTPTSKLEVIGDITVSKQNAFIELKDPDTADANYRLRNQGGSFSIYDITNNQVKIAATSGGVTIYPNLNANNGLDVMGTITGDGNLDIADGIRHYGDTNTSISFPSNDYIRLTTSNSSRLNVTPNGYILLGTNSEPSGGDAHARNARLFIQGRIGNTADSGRLNLQRGSAASNGSSIGSITFTDNSNNAYARIETIADAAPGANDFPGAIVFSTTPDGSASPTERLRIDSNGNVGIGIADPLYKLDLGESASTIRLVSENNGTAIRMGAGGDSNDITLVRVDGDSQGSNFSGESNSGRFGFSLKYMGSRNGNSNSLSVFSDNQNGTQVEAITIFQDGKTGVGIVDPQERLHVARTVMVTGNTPQIRLNANDSDASDNDRTMLGQATGNGNFVTTAVDNDTVLRGTTTGNLLFGVGTAEKFRISSNGDLTSTGPNNSFATLTYVSNFTKLDLRGNGIGNSKHYIIGYGAGHGSANSFHMVNSTSNGNLAFRTGSSGLERLRIDSNGNVGIGGNSPSAILHVTKAGDPNIIQENSAGNSLDRNNTYSFQFSDGEGAFVKATRPSGGSKANTYLAFGSGGSTERLRITSDGKVGIGTDTPTSPLDILLDNGAGYPRIRFDVTQDDPYIEFNRWTGTGTNYFGIRSRSRGGDLIFEFADNSTTIGNHSFTERLRITSAGKVNVGESAGLVGSKFNVFNGGDTENILGITGADESSEYAAIGVNGGNAIITGGGVGSTSTGIVFRTAGSGTEAERLRITATGNVGIGTNNPSFILETVQSNPGGSVIGAGIKNNSASTGSSVKFSLAPTDASGGIRAAELEAHNTNGMNAIALSFNISNGTAPIERMRISPVGNVGIGANNPSQLLELASTAPNIRLTDTVDGHSEIDGNAANLKFNADKGDEKADSNITFAVDNSEKVRIDSSGNVGIGTATPGYKLHVEGRALFTTGLQTSTISPNDLASRTNIHSGFYQADNATTMLGWPFSGWAHLTSNTHTNTSNYYAQQFASSFFNQELYFRNTQSGSTSTSQSWGQVMHTNSTLKPVYAESSGSAASWSRYWYPGGEYYVSVHGITAPGAMNDMIEQGYYHVANNTANNPNSNYGFLNVHRHAGSHYSLQHFVSSGDTSRQFMRASYPDSGQSSGRNWYQWHSYGALERENQFTNRQHIIGPSSTSTFTGILSNTSNNRAQFVLHSDYSDLVISSAQNNNNHGSTLSFVTSNPSNAADYNKFVINKGNYGTRNQFLEFGFQNIVAANPHDYVNSSYTVLTLDGANKRVGIGAAARTPSYPLHVEFAGDSGIYSASSNSHSSLYLNAASGNGSYIRMLAGGSSKFWMATDGSGHLNFRPNGGGTTVRMQNGGKLDAFNGLYVASSMTLANIELDFTTNNHKYIDFYCNTNQTAHLRVVNGNSYHHAVTMTRGGKTSICFNGAEKLYTTNTGVFCNGIYGSSDVNLKENIITVPNALDKVKAMRGVKFNWREDGRADYGVIAQEAETVVPELVSESESKKLTQAGALKKRPDESDYITTTQKGFSYNSMVGILIEAIKEQQATIDSLTARIDALENP